MLSVLHPEGDWSSAGVLEGGNAEGVALARPFGDRTKAGGGLVLVKATCNGGGT